MVLKLNTYHVWFEHKFVRYDIGVLGMIVYTSEYKLVNKVSIKDRVKLWY